MGERTLSRLIAISALGAAAMLAAMLAVSLLNGGATAQDFEVFQDPLSYTRDLLAAEGPLRAILTFDNLFLILYTAAFLLIAQAAWGKKSALLTIAALGAILITTYLDMQENAELLTFLTLAKNSFGVSAEMLARRMTLSQVKFLSSYLSFFLFAFLLPSDTFLEWLLKWSLWVLAPLVGVLVYTYPSNFFSLGRYLFMLSGLLLVAWNYWQRTKVTD
ncbi:MAG: hypothetical protein O3B43_05690 [Chloroflexi bacterium]|nr:hypothetical protein [Chloroflexota bacterium]